MTDPEKFRRLIGRLLYLNLSRPDLSYSVQQLSQFMSCPRQPHWDAAMHVVRYLKGNISQDLFYPAKSALTMTGFCDADWGACAFSR